MPGRAYSQSTNKYRYGFNGKENDNEVKGEGNQQDYGMRIYDTRLVRFLSVDPITKKYPSLTPYQFSSNSPIANIDLDGLEAWKVTQKWTPQLILKFQGEVNNLMSNIKSTNKAYTCEDFALTVAMTFARNNGLPFKWQTDSKSFDADDPNYSSFEPFLNDVKKYSGAPDFLNNANTSEISVNQITAGSLVTQTSKNPSYYSRIKHALGFQKNLYLPHHVSVVAGVLQNKQGQSAFFTAYQGNFKENAGRLFASSDPNSKSYPGTAVQLAGYNLSTDMWRNYTLKTFTQNISGEQNLNYRSFNFMQMNVDYKYELKTHSYTMPSSPTTQVPGSTVTEQRYEKVGTQHQ